MSPEVNPVYASHLSLVLLVYESGKYLPVSGGSCHEPDEGDEQDSLRTVEMEAPTSTLGDDLAALVLVWTVGSRNLVDDAERLQGRS